MLDFVIDFEQVERSAQLTVQTPKEEAQTSSVQ